MFEGFLKNSKWTGFGRKYYDQTGVIAYEGESLNNLSHGFGRYYRADGSIIYEGTLEKGKFHGFGRLYDDQGKLLYSGEWNQHCKHGLGKYQYDDDYVFEGRWDRDRKLSGTVTVVNQIKYNQIFFNQGELDHFRQRPSEEEEI